MERQEEGQPAGPAEGRRRIRYRTVEVPDLLEERLEDALDELVAIHELVSRVLAVIQPTPTHRSPHL
jgi:hypothetical protein